MIVSKVLKMPILPNGKPYYTKLLEERIDDFIGIDFQVLSYDYDKGECLVKAVCTDNLDLLNQMTDGKRTVAGDSLLGKLIADPIVEVSPQPEEAKQRRVRYVKIMPDGTETILDEEP